jgi:hypothetical protein
VVVFARGAAQLQLVGDRLISCVLKTADGLFDMRSKSGVSASVSAHSCALRRAGSFESDGALSQYAAGRHGRVVEFDAVSLS